MTCSCLSKIMPMTIQCLILQQLNKMFCIDCKIAIDWFEENGMKANPNKFHFMILSSNATDDIELKLDRNTTLSSEKSAKALGVTIDYRLTFDDHISAWCFKGSRQLNALARISKYLDIKSKKNHFRYSHKKQLWILSFSMALVWKDE